MNTTQRIVKNTTSLFFSGVFTRLLNSIIVVYLARVMGPGDFGKINFAVAIVAYFTMFANLGMPLLGAREIARDRENINYYLSNILTLRLCISILSFALLLLITFLLNKPFEIKYLIILYGLGLIPSALLLDWAFQGVEKMEYVGGGNILTAIIYVVLVLLFVKSPEELLLIPCFQVTGYIIAAGLIFSIFLRGFGRPQFKFDFISWRNILRQALPIGISIIMIQIIYNIDTVMLGFMRSNEEIGYYNAAYKIILLIILVGSTYFDAIYPVISNYYKTSLDSLKRLQDYTAKLMVTMAFPFALGGTILAKPIMNLLYGPKYNEGIIAFQILIWAAALIYVNMIYARGMWACNKQNEYVKIVITQAIVNIGLNFFLIPPLGTEGAAISTVCAEFLGFFFYYREFNKVVSIPIHNYIIRPLLASIVMALFLKLGVNMNIFLLIFGGMFIYTISLYLMKGITREDLMLVQSIVSGK